MSAHPHSFRSPVQVFGPGNMATGDPTATNGRVPLSHIEPVEGARYMTCPDRTLIPAEVASCRRCNGEVYALDWITNTLTLQERTWVCGSCCATGVLRLSMTLQETEPYTPAPIVVAPSWTSRQRVSV